MYIEKRNRNSDTCWIVTNYMEAQEYYPDSFLAEICSNGNIKIAFDAMDLTQGFVSEEDLALFYHYDEKDEVWVPLICNGRLL